VEVGLGTDIGAGTSLSLLATMNEAYKVQQLQGESLSPWKSFYLATLGGARALDLEDRIWVISCRARKRTSWFSTSRHTPAARAPARTANLFETLFVLSTLGDDRAVRETWIMGERRITQRDTAPVAPQRSRRFRYSAAPRRRVQAWKATSLTGSD
jgi:guanine deaminase